MCPRGANWRGWETVFAFVPNVEAIMVVADATGNQNTHCRPLKTFAISATLWFSIPSPDCLKSWRRGQNVASFLKAPVFSSTTVLKMHPSLSSKEACAIAPQTTATAVTYRHFLGESLHLQVCGPFPRSICPWRDEDCPALMQPLCYISENDRLRRG